MSTPSLDVPERRLNGVASRTEQNLSACPRRPHEWRDALYSGRRPMDFRLYHAINQFALSHEWLGRSVGFMEKWAVLLFALATFGLWLLARPGGPRKWKLASASALVSAGVALLMAQAIGRIWPRARPFAAHPGSHVWGSRSHDPSFPSDHASAAFGIAFAVFLFDRLVGSFFLAAASTIAIGRVFVGAHYPADVLAGTLVGLGAALLVVRTAMPLIERTVRLAEYLTDPLVAAVRRWNPARARSRA